MYLYFYFLYKNSVKHIKVVFPTITFLFSQVVLYLCCHLLWYWRQIGGLFPAGYIQRLCYWAARGCLILNAGLNELCGGIWNRLICGCWIPSWTCIAKVGVVECFNLIEFVGEIHISVYGCLRPKLSLLFVFWVVSIVGYAVGWVRETKQHMSMQEHKF